MIKINTSKSNLDVDQNIYQLLLNEVGAYVFLKDRDRKYVYVNEITRKLFNRNLDQIIGFDDSEFFDINDLSELVRNDSRVLDLGETVAEEEMNIIKATGEIKVYLSVKKPIYNNNQKIIGLLGISTDFTDIHILKEELKKQSITDSLTGLYNFRFFSEAAERSYSESNRHHHPLSLIILDIDFFKKINDTYGHLVGNEVIIFISKHIASLIRKEDILARVGGEEFAILLANSNLEAALTLAEKIRSSVSEQTIYGDWDGGIKFTVSLGVTTHNQSDHAFHAMHERADSALYDAKETGRNRVCSK